GFSNEALRAAGKGLERLMKAYETIGKLKPAESSSAEIKGLENRCYEALNDDLNSPVLLAHLFEAVKTVNAVYDGTESLTAEDILKLKELFRTFVFDILGLKEETEKGGRGELTGRLIELLLDIRNEARNKKDFATSDAIRDGLKRLGIIVKDRKDGVDWELE
ncbi:MAG TPA: cysteine--tRNA ligase, partial [Bacteroidales bacterium]|nr:cysteine--tRNA ligase [Bacteroidales bacterium]